MIVYRLAKSKFIRDLSGKGAELCGGRWNSKGVAVIYTGETRALCSTEIAVHSPLGNLPLDYEICSIEIPDTIEVKILSQKELPGNWKSIPHSYLTQLIGDKFVSENKYAVLKVPSVVVEGEFNYLINPKHPDFNKIKICDVAFFNFDERLFIK